MNFDEFVTFVYFAKYASLTSVVHSISGLTRAAGMV